MNTMNDVYKKLLVLTGFTFHEIREALDAAGVDVSRSRQKGWTCSPDNRHYYRMREDELLAVLDALIAYERRANPLITMKKDDALRRHTHDK